MRSDFVRNVPPARDKAMSSYLCRCPYHDQSMNSQLYNGFLAIHYFHPSACGEIAEVSCRPAPARTSHLHLKETRSDPRPTTATSTTTQNVHSIIHYFCHHISCPLLFPIDHGSLTAIMAPAHPRPPRIHSNSLIRLEFARTSKG